MFGQFVKEKFGIGVWDDLLETVRSESGGIYTSTDTYDNEELFALLDALSEMTRMDTNDLIRSTLGKGTTFIVWLPIRH